MGFSRRLQMVSYQRWTSICFEVAEQKGAQFGSISDGSEAVTVFASIWSERKGELSAATVAEAEAVAEDEIVA